VNAEIAKHLQPQTPAQSSSTQGPSLADELLKLKNLLEVGAISDEEFQVLKAKLIS
jgi:hypothetical protein